MGSGEPAGCFKKKDPGPGRAVCLLSAASRAGRVGVPCGGCTVASLQAAAEDRALCSKEAALCRETKLGLR